MLTEYFLWQTLVGAWPISEGRLQAYALKAIRESKLYTRWTEPDEAYESAVERFVSGVVTTPEIVAHVESWVGSTRLEARANVLGQKLVQLTMPGVPDVYQGTDLIDLSLVDPDNRRAVDYTERRDRLARLDGGAVPADLHDEKLLVTSAALRTRRERADFFTGENATYLPVATTSEHAVAFGRGTGEAVEVVTVVTRLAGRLADAGGYGEATVELPRVPGPTSFPRGRSTVDDSSRGRRGRRPARRPARTDGRRVMTSETGSIRVWAPLASRVDILVTPLEGQHEPTTAVRRHAMTAEDGGWWSWARPDRGTLAYSFSLDGRDPRPDPRSAWLPHGCPRGEPHL